MAVKLIRNKSRSNNVVKMPKTYEIDGCRYTSKSLMDYHIELNEYKLKGIIDSFELPTYNTHAIKSKMGNKKLYIDNILFDSIVESRFYLMLKIYKLKGMIKSYELQKKYVLQPKFIKNGKTIREISYIADFVIINKDNGVNVIDIKGLETDVFKIKHKLFEYVYPDLTLVCYVYSAKNNEWYPIDYYNKNIKKKRKQA